MTLLQFIQETHPQATQEMIDSTVAQFGGSNEDSILASDAKKIAFRNKIAGQLSNKLAVKPSGFAPVKKEAQRSIASVESDRVDEVAFDETPIEGDRDWGKVTPNELQSLTISELRLYKAWRVDENERLEMLKELSGLNSIGQTLEADVLKVNQSDLDLSLELERSRTAFNLQSKASAELQEAVTASATAIAEDKVSRLKKSLKSIEALETATPTVGEIAQAKAQDRYVMAMNNLVDVRNGTPIERQLMSGASEPAMRTVEAVTA